MLLLYLDVYISCFCRLVDGVGGSGGGGCGGPHGENGDGTRSGEEEEDFHTRFWHQRSLGRKFCPAGVRVQGRGDINCLDNNVHTHALLVRSALRNFGPETNCAFLPLSSGQSFWLALA